MTLKKLLRMNKCIYDVCWKGECGESVEDESDFCSEHINKKCKCGNQANGDCHKYNGCFLQSILCFCLHFFPIYHIRPYYF